MRKRDRLLPKFLQPKPIIPSKPQILSSAVQPLPQSTTPHASSILVSQGSTITTSASRNQALELAIQKHLHEIPDAEKEAFREASKNIDEANLLSKAQACDEAHKSSSYYRPQAERLSKFLNVLNRFMGGVAIGIQAYPEISSLVVGAVRIVINLAIDFVTFFSKLTDMICQFEDYLGALAEYAKAPQDLSLVQDGVANIYGDLLCFCRKARSVFVDRNGDRRKLTSLRLFLRQQWEPFETEFGTIRANMQHHLDVILHTTQALQFTALREAEQMRLHVENGRPTLSLICRRRSMSSPVNLITDKERTSFLDWISNIDFEKMHDDIYTKKHEGTGDWLIQKQEFQTWFGSSQSSLLWCHGKRKYHQRCRIRNLAYRKQPVLASQCSRESPCLVYSC